jgi:hypothetical protein
MRTMVLAAAASLAAIATPADAQDRPGSGGFMLFNPSENPAVDQWSASSAASFDRSGHRSGRHHDRHSDRGFDGPVGWYGGDWAYYNNRSFSSESYNDWWHDRPDRAFPRWMQNNQNCQRLWWSGGGWRC